MEALRRACIAPDEYEQVGTPRSPAGTQAREITIAAVSEHESKPEGKRSLLGRTLKRLTRRHKREPWWRGPYGAPDPPPSVQHREDSGQGAGL